MTHATPLLRRPDQTLWQQGALIVAASLFIAIAAQVAVPMWPVPITLSTLAVLTVGLSLGPRMGALAVLTYLAEGAMGLPVFANGGAGLAYMTGPTGGFLLGYVAMAYIAGLAARASLLVMLGATLAASVLLYVPGLAWPLAVASAMGVDASWASSEAAALWSGWMQPFLIGDALKAVLAALLVAGGLKTLKR
ncbi:Biotin transporter BioY [Rhodobacteraceae bacterium THAF1]|uniref:biotin transporter BioY n=1 Tax=Palleronia sp. THAF1 TaxID=2587842 RepID=UPI000F41C558|nr:biotin transporter BioY [Palleronia sp. THAF1]QFU09367.1 Biotin transporter BioY [Palleronia sp. THAF1]VDC22051.1 Biotin transporter BioY [Rhodobacteraceae bacterium THAF1]